MNKNELRAIIEAMPVSVQAIIITDPLDSLIAEAQEEIYELIKEGQTFEELTDDGTVHDIVDGFAMELLPLGSKQFRSYLYFHGDEGIKALAEAYGECSDDIFPNGSLIAGAYQLIHSAVWECSYTSSESDSE